MRLSVILLALLLAGCGHFTKPAAPVGDAGAMCYQKCTPSLTDTGVRWNGDPEDPAAWDALGDEVLSTLSRMLLTCEARRQECSGFIQSLKKRGVIRAKD
jgi:hypothetical protein